MGNEINKTEVGARELLAEINALKCGLELMDDQFISLESVKMDAETRLKLAAKGRVYAQRARERLNQIFYS